MLDLTPEGRAVIAPQQWTIDLSFMTPPLMSNGRYHWAHRAAMTRLIHTEVIWRCRQLHIPALIYPTVQLHWQPTTHRRRDSDGPIPTSKAILDAIVKAHVITDDTADLVNHLMPKIHAVAKPGRCWVTVTR